MAKDTYIRFRISSIKKDKLQAIADKNGESMTYILEKLIDKYIESVSNTLVTNEPRTYH